MESSGTDSELESLLVQKGKARPIALPGEIADGIASPYADLPLTERPQGKPRLVKDRGAQAELPHVGEGGDARAADDTSESALSSASSQAEDDGATGGSLLQLEFRRWRLSEDALAPIAAGDLGAERESADGEKAESTTANLVAIKSEADARVTDAKEAGTPGEAPPVSPVTVEKPGPSETQLRAKPLAPLRAEAKPAAVAARSRKPWSKAGWAAVAATILVAWFWMTGGETPESTVATAPATAPAEQPAPTAAQPAEAANAVTESVAPTPSAAQAQLAAQTQTASPAQSTASPNRPPATETANDPPSAAGESTAAARPQDTASTTAVPGSPASPIQESEADAGIDAAPALSASGESQAGTSADLAEPRPAGDAGQPEAIAPAFDIVRIEANGDALIAGTASPGSELIILDNGAPIGSVKVDAAGGWMLIPEKPLAQGDHEFSLLLNAPQGSVKVRFEETISRPRPKPQAPDKTSADMPLSPGRKPPAPAVAATPDLTPKLKPKPQVLRVLAEDEVSPPIPIRNPVRSEPAATADAEAHIAAYVIQLSSAPNAVGAAQEWTKLQRRFPDTLRNMELKLHKVEDDDRGTLYRIRTGPFAQRADAQAYCSRFKAQDQDCLVVER